MTTGTTAPKAARTVRKARAAAGLLVAAVAALGLAGCASGPQWPSAAGSPVGSPTTAAAPTTTAPAGTSAPAGTASGGSGGGTAPGGGSGGSGGAEGARCTTPELRGSLGPAEGAAGSTYRTLILTNVSSRTCSLRGFPGVSYVQGDNGAQLGPAATMSGPRGGDVRLVPGGAAGAELRLANVQNFDAAVCRPTPAEGLRVYPPGDTASLFVRQAGTGCAGTPPGDQLTIATLTAR